MKLERDCERAERDGEGEDIGTHWSETDLGKEVNLPEGAIRGQQAADQSRMACVWECHNKA